MRVNLFKAASFKDPFFQHIIILSSRNAEDQMVNV